MEGKGTGVAGGLGVWERGPPRARKHTPPPLAARSEFARNRDCSGGEGRGTGAGG